MNWIATAIEWLLDKLLGHKDYHDYSIGEETGTLSQQLQTSEQTNAQLQKTIAVDASSAAAVVRKQGDQITRDLSAPINIDDTFRRD